MVAQAPALLEALTGMKMRDLMERLPGLVDSGGARNGPPVVVDGERLR